MALVRTDRVVLRGHLVGCGENHVEVVDDQGRPRKVRRDMIRAMRSEADG